HHSDMKIWDRSNGRIYKICYRGTKPVQVDLSKKSNQELIELQLHPNDWYVRHARRLLQERGGKPEDFKRLQAILTEHKDETRRLRALWACHALVGDWLMQGGKSHLDVAREDPSPYVRAWAIQLQHNRDDLTKALPKADPSPVVRLYQAAALQRLQG